ncbi:metal ABC transporter solute-binding protein, Zn/Mn family [Geminocystis herdmanii]|uniref:metal ABC transporter solute-binding protein, Zn/Mn family n=1 Tax=Geminocystis herdmanii TaxID=669359 RepID=UPI000372AB28|nr:zinc ABC transporter substrate-binding protein [Geminocystis herdmanii]
MLRKFSILTIFIGLWGCTPSPNVEKTAETSSENLPLVVATTSVLCDLTEQVAQDTVNLKCLVAPGVDPHVYQPTPDDRQSIENADLVFYGGYNFDPNLIKLIKATSNSNLKIAVHEQAVPNPIMASEHHHGEEDHNHDHDHGSEEKVPDPHVWHDPKNGVAMIEVITQGLSQLQPDLAEKYQTRSNDIKTELGKIDQWIGVQIATIPPEKRKLVTTHDALGYYVTAYGIDFQGALSGLSTEESPSANTVANLVKDIKKTQVPTIFAESSVNPKLIETVAKEANVQVSTQELYADGLGEKGTEGESYQKMLISNTKAIVEGLGGQYTAFN